MLVRGTKTYAIHIGDWRMHDCALHDGNYESHQLQPAKQQHSMPQWYRRIDSHVNKVNKH
jgi:hypothetical protein